MRIALVIDHLGPGGAQRQITMLSAFLASEGKVVRVYTYADGCDFLLGPVEVVRPSFARGRLRRLARLECLIRLIIWRPTMTISFLQGPSLLAALAKLLSLGLMNLIVSERNSGVIGKEPLRDKFYRRVADEVVANSEARALELESDDSAGQITFIPNFLPHIGQECAKQESEVRRIVAVGRVTHQKGCDLLIGAISRLQKQLEVDLEIHWIGQDLSSANDFGGHSVEQIAASSGVKFSLIPPMRDPLRSLTPRDLFVLPSRHEGTPNVLLEAMALGRLVVATRVGDVCNYLVDGESGILCDPSIESIADGIQRALDLDQATREKMGHGAQLAIRCAQNELAVGPRWLRVIQRNAK